MTICSPVVARRRVLLMPMYSTVPFSSPTASASPTRNGLSSAMDSEANRSPEHVLQREGDRDAADAETRDQRPDLDVEVRQQHQERDDPGHQHADEAQDVEARSALRLGKAVAAAGVDRVPHDGGQPMADLPPHDDQDRDVHEAVDPGRRLEPAQREINRDRKHEDTRGRVDQRAHQERERDRVGGHALAQPPRDERAQQRQHREPQGERQHGLGPRGERVAVIDGLAQLADGCRGSCRHLIRARARAVSASACSGPSR